MAVKSRFYEYGNEKRNTRNLFKHTTNNRFKSVENKMEKSVTEEVGFVFSFLRIFDFIF